MVWPQRPVLISGLRGPFPIPASPASSHVAPPHQKTEPIAPVFFLLFPDKSVALALRLLSPLPHLRHPLRACPPADPSPMPVHCPVLLSRFSLCHTHTRTHPSSPALPCVLLLQHSIHTSLSSMSPVLLKLTHRYSQ